MNITLSDGSVRAFEDGMTALGIAAELSQKLAKNTLSARIDGVNSDAFRPIGHDCKLELLDFDDEQGRWAYRHTASHVLAQAVKRLFPSAKLAIGPAIADGFYYDFDVDTPFSTDDLERIEKEMAKIQQENAPLERFELPRAEAIAYMEKRGEPYKVELIRDLPEDAIISFYKQGDFVDLCAGPHVVNTGKIKNVKLMSVAGAYWRGSEKNKMLQRIYGTAFEKKADLDAYIYRIEEAKKRDHRKLGRELDLFSLHDEGPGFPFFHPKGMVIRNALEDFWRREHRKRGYQEIRTPIILNRELWIRSGHWDHYKENMYFTKIDDEDYAVKPMNCPGSMIVYGRRIYSYRDLPLRLAELGLVHRHELSGALHGLMRVRCFTQDDAHIFMTPDQIKQEINGVIEKFEYFYNTFGFKYSVELSTRPEDSMGSDEDWELATNALREVLVERGMPFVVNEGDGAFYGPKIDFHLEDAIGRTWQCGTIQLDFQMPERFDLTYVGADGEKHRPVMIHTVVFGSIERFIAILTENCTGAFPTWVAPVQVKVLALTDRSAERAKEIEALLNAMDYRAESDTRNEKVGFKIREAQNERVPYMLVIGDKELESGDVAVRERGKGDIGAMSLDAFIAMLKEKVDTRAL
jgi:threonyl-tRNA synthetase